MYFEWDEKKRSRNIAKHGVDFTAACRLWESSLLVNKDTRQQYGESRWIGMGKLSNRVMVVVFTQRFFNTIRIISCRKANCREVQYYEKATGKNTKI